MNTAAAAGAAGLLMFVHVVCLVTATHFQGALALVVLNHGRHQNFFQGGARLPVQTMCCRFFVHQSLLNGSCLQKFCFEVGLKPYNCSTCCNDVISLQTSDRARHTSWLPSVTSVKLPSLIVTTTKYTRSHQTQT